MNDTKGSSVANLDKPMPERQDTEKSTDSDVGYSSPNSVDGIVEDQVDVAPHLTDSEKLARAKGHLKDDQVLAAARLLKSIREETTLSSEQDQAFQDEVQRKTSLIQSVLADLLTDPDEEWIKMRESHSEKRDTVMYYQITEDSQLKCRLETPIESSLLVPLLSVLNETDLFASWLPRWDYPRIGLDKVEKIAQVGRTEQTVQFISRVPWPFPARDVILQTLACDDIDDIEGPTTGSIVIGLHSLEEGDVVRKSTVAQDHYKDVEEVMSVPPCPEGMTRAAFDGGLLIRKCPDDHITLQDSTIKYPPGEHLILVEFSMRIDADISPMFPTWIINFVISTAISAMWQKFLDIAEEIRSGSRPQHTELIAQKRGEIYDWVDQRIEDMFAQLQQSETVTEPQQAD